MRLSFIDRLTFAAALASSLAVPVAVRAQDGIPVMSVVAAEQLPPGQRPAEFRSTNPPYRIHRTDGFSRNPDDCMRWGCIDHR
jgi:hypothetical protein